MIRSNSDTEIESNPKKKRLNENEETEALVRVNGEQSGLQQERPNTITSDNEADVVHLAAPEFNEQSPDKLPVEIMIEIFNFLEFSDLNSACKTSKWWQKVACTCYQQNYPNIFTSYSEIMNFDAFNQVVKRILFYCPENIQHFLDNKSEFHQLRAIEFHFLDLTKSQILFEEPLLSKLEHLSVIYCEMEPNFVQNILALCPNLKYFCFKQRTDIKIGSEWLLRKYPSLNRFSIRALEIHPITSFLELNPNIRTFEINSVNLWENRDSLKASKVSLDDLAVKIDAIHLSNLYPRHSRIEYFEPICRLLNELHELGIYKRLKLYVLHRCKQILVDEMASLKALVKLYILEAGKGPFALSTLQTIEEIHVSNSTDIYDIEAMACNLVNLKIMHIHRADLKCIMSLTRHAKKLEKLRIDILPTHEVINVAALNRERSKLPNAEKIGIFLKELHFLAAKRIQRELGSDLVKIHRSETLILSHDFQGFFIAKVSTPIQ